MAECLRKGDGSKGKNPMYRRCCWEREEGVSKEWESGWLRDRVFEVRRRARDVAGNNRRKAGAVRAPTREREREIEREKERERERERERVSYSPF